MSELILKPKEEARLRGGHLWVFSNEVSRINGLAENGEIVEVISSRAAHLGRAYYNRHTLIAARLLTHQREEIDAGFFERRFRRALRWRQQILGQSRSFRFVYSEGDFLPGLIVDKYEDVLAVQLLTLGMEKLAVPVVEVLERVLEPAAVVLRRDSPYRELEGLSREAPAVVCGTEPKTVTIEEAGVRFVVDVMRGQKTGFFFDQRDARAVVRGLANGRRVLDCFSYTGGFAINCALAGATQVLAVDSSGPALDILRENARLNDVDRIISVEQGDCIDVLRELDGRRERFDLIILDPPAFVKSKSQIRAGISGYREINRIAARLLAPDGILATFSCSQNLSTDQFARVLFQAAGSAGRQFRIVRYLVQAADHPILQAMPETQYLKGVVLQAL